jgi:hypothetical protein
MTTNLRRFSLIYDGFDIVQPKLSISLSYDGVIVSWRNLRWLDGALLDLVLSYSEIQLPAHVLVWEAGHPLRAPVMCTSLSACRGVHFSTRSSSNWDASTNNLTPKRKGARVKNISIPSEFNPRGL